MFNLFGHSNNSTPAAAAPAPAQPAVAEPGNMPPAGDVNAQAPTGIAPTDPTVTPATPEAPAAEGDNSPLEQFKDMWDTVPKKEGDSTTPAQLDPAKLKDVIAKADFSQVITQENLAAITAGGDEATTAFASSMNQVAQQVMNQSLLASNKMIEQAVEQVNSQWESKLPQLLKKQNLNENLVGSDPLFNNPAIKPIMEATQTQLAAKYPNATVAELANMTQDYIKAMGEAFSPKPINPVGESKSNTDWEAFMTNG